MQRFQTGRLTLKGASRGNRARTSKTISDLQLQNLLPKAECKLMNGNRKLNWLIDQIDHARSYISTVTVDHDRHNSQSHFPTNNTSCTQLLVLSHAWDSLLVWLMVCVTAEYSSLLPLILDSTVNTETGPVSSSRLELSLAKDLLDLGTGTK